MGNKKAQGRLSARRAATFLAALGALVMSSGVALMVTATPANASQDEVHKSYVCKYVNKPGGGTELLQTGQNPIWVDNHSIAGKDVVSVGDKFADAQGFSVVIVANTPKLDPEPGIDQCPGEENPPEELVATATVSFTDPTCAAPGTGSITKSAEHASFVVTPDKASYSVGDAVTVTATADSGAAFGSGATTSWSHTFVASDAPCPSTVVNPPTTETESTVVVSTPKHKTKTKSQAAAVTPTVVEAGLVSTSTNDLRGEQGLALMVAGMVMLVGAGGLGLRVRSVASRS
jgi:hypothetical protein